MTTSGQLEGRLSQSLPWLACGGIEARGVGDGSSGAAGCSSAVSFPLPPCVSSFVAASSAAADGTGLGGVAAGASPPPPLPDSLPLPLALAPVLPSLTVAPLPVPAVPSAAPSALELPFAAPLPLAAS